MHLFGDRMLIMLIMIDIKINPAVMIVVELPFIIATISIMSVVWIELTMETIVLFSFEAMFMFFVKRIFLIKSMVAWELMTKVFFLILIAQSPVMVTISMLLCLNIVIHVPVV